MFGPEQRRTYTDLFHHAARLIAAEPRRVGSKSRDDLRSGLRSLHLDRAAGRQGASAHMLYYVESVLEDGAPGVTILRILHHHMDPGRHLVGDLN
jgi:toxin ParE1/3/4